MKKVHLIYGSGSADFYESAEVDKELERLNKQADDLRDALAIDDKEIARLRRVEVAQAEEVDEFNAGFRAYNEGMELDNAEMLYRAALPDDVMSHDVFGCGYAWAKFTAEKLAALKEMEQA